MSFSGLVTRHVDRQKEELLNYLLLSDAVTPESAIDLATFPVKRSILQEMINRRIVLRASSGRFYLDASRMSSAYGASLTFTAYAIVAMLLAIFAMYLL